MYAFNQETPLDWGGNDSRGPPFTKKELSAHHSELFAELGRFFQSYPFRGWTAQQVMLQRYILCGISRVEVALTVVAIPIGVWGHSGQTAKMHGEATPAATSASALARGVSA